MWEPVMQITGMYQMGMLPGMVFGAGLFIFIFAGNLIPITLFKKYGFLAPVIWRLADYSLWYGSGLCFIIDLIPAGNGQSTGSS
jgi:hypothetical protein